MAFLFKYSIDMGWLTEPVRIAFGLGLGTALLAIGLRFHKERRHFSHVLLGGSIATYYITGFAAFQLYHLVDYPVAFGYMALVTALAFVLSVRQSGVVLALIGAFGGLATPFLLYTDTVNVPGLMGYTCLLLAGTSAIFFFRNWHSLLWTTYSWGLGGPCGRLSWFNWRHLRSLGTAVGGYLRLPGFLGAPRPARRPQHNAT